jgi:DNA-binding response OmpR family regulator
MSRPRVVVAHGEAAIRDSAVAVARSAGHEVIAVPDGESVRLLLRTTPPPAALVVDVALPGALGYELCDEIAAMGLPTRVILIASVYSKTAYKRRPTSLYGAADYVEQHHIVDQLGPKLGALLEGYAAPVRRRSMSDTGEQKAAAIRDAGEERLAFTYRNRREGEDRARSLARLLVADMMLYVGDLIADWRARGAPDDMPEELRADVAEARRLYALRVPPEIAAARDYFGDALRAGLRGSNRTAAHDDDEDAGA